MIRYLLRRAAHFAFLLFGVSVLVFLFSAMAPGSYFDEMRMNSQISRETLAALRAQYDLDRPLPLRYAKWVSSVARGEMGYSFAYNAPVAPLLWVRVRNTLLLSLTATLISWVLALFLGVWSAERFGRLPDRIITGATAALLVLPELVLALLFLVLAAHSGWFPVGGMVSPGFDSLTWPGKALDLALHLALPAAVLVLAALPLLVRHVRAAVAEALDSGFIRAAEAHGISRPRLLFR